MCVEDFRASLLNPEEENLDSTSAAESWKLRENLREPKTQKTCRMPLSLWQYLPAKITLLIPTEVPSNPSPPFQKKMVHWDKYGPGFLSRRSPVCLSIQQTSVWSGLWTAHHHHHTWNKARRVHRPGRNRDSTAPW